MLSLVRILLSPFVFVYAVIVKTRNYFFEKGVFPIRKVNAKVISIGNLTVGGSGKTPAVLMLSGFLKSQGKKVGVLSRGYGRKSNGYIYVSDGNKINTTVEKCGDEIYLVADELKIPAAVCERRVKGANNFIRDSHVDTIILDDAFQHRWIARNIDIVLVDQRFLIKTLSYDQGLLPLGMMREPFEALERADIIIINRKFSAKANIPEKFNSYFENKNVFNGYYQTNGFFDVKNHQHFNLEDFVGQKSLIVCGIAKPYSFLNVLEQNHIDFTNKLLYPDHKNYCRHEVKEIRKKFYDTNSFSVITTQKDAVKLSNFSKELDDIDIYYLKIELKIDEQEQFDRLVLNKLN